MEQSFPGFLYAKSLRPEDPPAEGYREWFSHSDFAPLKGLVKSLLDSFDWRVDSSRRHAPVFVAEPIPDDGRVLAVRFSDAGRDAIGRSQTLRMEAVLVPADLVPRLWDGTFSAEPDPGRAMFRIACGAPAPGFPGLGGSRVVNGNPDEFILDGKAASPATRPERREAARREPSVVHPPGAIQEMKHSKIPLAAAVLALVASLAGNAFQFVSNEGRTESLEARLSQTERERDVLRSQLAGLETDRAAIVAFRSQFDAFSDCVRELEGLHVRLNGIRTAMDETIQEHEAGGTAP